MNLELIVGKIIESLRPYPHSLSRFHRCLFVDAFLAMVHIDTGFVNAFSPFVHTSTDTIEDAQKRIHLKMLFRVNGGFRKCSVFVHKGVDNRRKRINENTFISMYEA